MKKILLLFLGFTVLSCSSDDAPASVNNNPQSVEIVSYDYAVAESNSLGHLMNFTATVKNNTSENVSGKVMFKVPNGNSVSHEYIYNVTLNPGETNVFTEQGNAYFPNETITIQSVSFVPLE